MKISHQQMALLFGRLGVMVNSAVPLHNAVEYLVEIEDDETAKVMSRVCQKILGGSRLSWALQSEGTTFSPLICYLVQAGEDSGRLGEVLTQISDLLARGVALRRKVVAAFTYPAILLGLTGLIVGFLGVFVLPREKEFLEQMGGDLPLITEVVMFVLTTLCNPVLAGLMALVVVNLAVTWPWVGAKFYEKNVAREVDRVLLMLPLAGKIFHKVAAARVLRSMANMLDSGLSFGKPMECLGGVFENRELESRFQVFLHDVQEGKSLYAASHELKVFPGVASQMLRVGEENGRLGELIQKTANMFEEDVEMSLQTLAALLEPMAMAVMGLVIGTIVVAIALPTMNMVSVL